MQNDSKNTKINKYLSIPPYLTTERSQKFFGVVLTLCALSFFGIFAISPTLSTIFKLQKELSDNEFIFSQLENKIKNLSELRTQYANLQNDFPVITNAIAIQPEVHLLFAQIQSAAQLSNITIKKLQNFEVEIIGNTKTVDKNYQSYSFSIGGIGSLADISQFVATITSMERIINIDSFSIDNTTEQNTGSLGFDIKGTAFFKDNL